MKKKSDELHKNKTGSQDTNNIDKRAEESQLEDAEKYQNILKNIHDGCFELDLAGNFTFFNDSACRILGYSREELMGMNYRHYTDKENAKKVSEAYLKVYNTGEPSKGFNWVVTRKDGAKRYIETSVSLQKDSSGKPTGFIGIVNDITERKLSEEELRESEEKYRLIFEYSPLGLLSFDEKGVIVACNDNFVKIIGSSREKLIGLNMLKLPNKNIVSAVQKALNGSPGLYEGDYSSVTAKKITPVRCLFAPIDVGGGRISGGVGIIEDITERKQSENALKESENKYRLLADNIDDVIFVLDMNLNFTYVSPSIKILMGYEPEEFLNLRASETMTPSSWDLVIKKMSEIMEIEKSEHREIDKPEVVQLEMRRKDGNTVWTEVKASFVRDEDKRPVGIIGVTRDITERKRSEESLSQSEEKYRTILEEMQEGYFEVDLAGNFTFFNDSLSRYFDFSKEELMGMNYRQYTDKEYSKKLFQAFNKVYNTGEPAERFDWQIIRKDRTKRYVEASISLKKDSSDKPTGFRGIARDVTERKKAEEELKQTIESLRKAVGVTIQVMVSAIEMRDPYTAGHQKRVADLARAIATEMGLSQEKIDGIRMVGSIHDIGKLSIPAEILSKPTKLTEIEFSLIKEHARSGYEMLKYVESPWPLAEIVYQHHERMNGSGYPRNLKGDEIIMEARIMAVADVVEAMASHRPYRPGLGMDAALAEIEKNKGTHYDNTVADACLRLFREKGYQLT